MERLRSFDGTELAVHRVGQGRPLILLHGLFSTAQLNWVRYGHAELLAEAGFEVIMPDLRAHGDSGKPHDPAAYPADVLAMDLAALVSALGLTDYDLGGFSLGARTCVRGVIAQGLRPRKLVLGGMGLEGLTGWASRSAHFLDVIDRFGMIERGQPGYFEQAFMKTMGVDPVAMRLLLQSVDDTPPEALSGITMETLVVCGAEDQDNGSAPRLAEVLPRATYAEVPGTHMSCVTRRELGEAIAGFLSGKAVR